MNSQNLPTPDSDQDKSAVIKVFGVGGGGCNALEQMIAADINGVQFKCLNTDAQALEKYAPENVIELGTELTKGLGAGANPEVGCAAAEESREEIAAAIGDADMLFVTAGMGGGTGTGAVPVVARIAREMNVLTVAVVTEPFAFEGEKRRTVAEAGLAELRENADSMIVVPNENLMTYLGPNVSLIEAFGAANDVVTNAVQSIAELITTSGLINVDFADVKTVMTEMGHAIMSTGSGMGENRAEEAATSAIESPLLNNVDLKAAKGILANITSSSDLSMGEFQIVGDIIRQIADDDATVVVGTVFDDDMSHEMKVTVVATGLKPPDRKTKKKRTPAVSTPSREAAENAVQDAADGTSKSDSAANPEIGGAQPVADQHAPDQHVMGDRQPNDTYQAQAQASQAHAAQEKASQEQVAQPAATASGGAENKISSIAGTDACVICGGTQGTHKAKCPWSKESDTAANDAPVSTEPVAARAAAASPQKVEVEAVEPAAKGTGNGKKIGVAAVAGVLAVASALYFVIGGKKDSSDNTVVEAPQATEDSSDRHRVYLPHKIPTLSTDGDELETDVTELDDQ